jgi:hypothetical protein
MSVNTTELNRIIQDSKAKARLLLKWYWPSSLASGRSSPAPKWHTPTELYDYLRGQNYDRVIAEELAAKYAENLQRAFAKGWSMAERKYKRENADLSGVGEAPATKPKEIK